MYILHNRSHVTIGSKFFLNIIFNKSYSIAKTWFLCQYSYTHSSSGLAPARSRQYNEYMPMSVTNVKNNSSKPEKRQST